MVSVTESIASLSRPKRAPSKAELKRRFFASQQWRRLRYRIICENKAAHGGVITCSLCRATSSPGGWHVDHHPDPISKNWERRADPSNLRVTCRDCNLGKMNRPLEE